MIEFLVALILLIILLWFLNKKTEDKFASKRANEIYNNSKPLYNKTGGDVSYKSFKNSTGENQIVHHNVNKLYNKDKMTPENIDKII